MQLMPETARALGVEDPFDIWQNVEGGARYLKQMLGIFDGDLERALAAYNAGPQALRQSGGEIPYDETRRYVERVLAYLNLS
jgi:soluble lytic murein transglycosylase-like protein